MDLYSLDSGKMASPTIAVQRFVNGLRSKNEATKTKSFGDLCHFVCLI